MSNERDELIAHLYDSAIPVNGVYAISAPTSADHLLEFGYRKPRTITTAEELDALAERTVYINDDGEVMRANGKGYDDSNLDAGWLVGPTDVPLPAVVLWEPNA